VKNNPFRRLTARKISANQLLHPSVGFRFIGFYSRIIPKLKVSFGSFIIFPLAK